MTFGPRTRISLLMAAVTGLAVMAGCPGLDWPGDGDSGQAGVGLTRFASGDDLLDFFKQQAMARRGWTGNPFGGWPLLALAPGAAPDVGALEGSGDSQGDAAGTYSTTNIQEYGVDESDTFKSDGQYFYIASGTTVRIVRAVPAAELTEVGRVELGAPVDSLYLLDSKLIVLGQKYADCEPGEDGPEILIWPPYREAASVVVCEVDTYDPAAPSVVGQIELDGSLVSSRLTGGRLFLVLTIAPSLPENPGPLTLGFMTLDQVLPHARREGVTERMVDWDDYYRPNSASGYYSTAVVTLDASNVEQIIASTAVMADADTIYASTAALYVTSSRWDEQDGSGMVTAIHKFALDEQAGARYVGSGSAPGSLLNQFSLGEHEGFLRVATHIETLGFLAVTSEGSAGAARQSAGPYNAVFVLGESSDGLEIVGRVEDIAPGETLHSARFMGNHGFLVTYRKVDPLFVLDLATPTDPKVVGELKVPGFSEYLHPLDETHLIGVGTSTVATSEGFDWFQGVQISLFDVSDWSNPTAVQQVTLGGRGSYSEVERTHKAFTFLPQTGLLAIPMHLYSVEQLPFQMGELEFDGVVAFRVDKSTGFTELGRIQSVGQSEYPVWTAAWRRAAFIDEVLYALDPGGVRATPLSNVASATTVVLGQ